MKVRLAYSKIGKVRFLGHLDMARLWERALRKADVPVAVSVGFTPRPKVSFGLALPTAAESLVELLDVTLVDEVDGVDVDLSRLAARLSAALPEGIDVTAAVPVLGGGVSLQEDVSATTWVLALDRPADEVDRRVREIVAATEVWLERERKGERRRDDVRLGILGLTLPSPEWASGLPAGWLGDVNGTLIEATLTTSGRGVRPTEVVEALFPGVEPWSVLTRVLRTTQWIERDDAPCAPPGVRNRKDLSDERLLATRTP